MPRKGMVDPFMEAQQSDLNVPDLKQIIGALIYGAPEPLNVKALRKILREVAADLPDDEAKDAMAAFSDVSEDVIRSALDALRIDLEQGSCGIHLVEIAEGYRFFTDPACAPWLRHVLQADKPARLSRPALETLAIVAYRQPVARSEIEAVRGVGVDHVVRNLMELQLVRIVGRSELPGRPLLYGTTQRFLEHFGLRDLSELPGVAELARRDQAAVGKERVPVVDGVQPEEPAPSEPAIIDPDRQTHTPTHTHAENDDES